MYELTVRRQFDAAHHLEGYPGRCARLHGHTWLVEVTAAGDELDEHGMLIDFHELQRLVEETVKDLDHQDLNALAPFRHPGRETNPTAENIARYIYRRLKTHLQQNGLKLMKVKVWESPDAWAGYGEG